MRVVCVAGARPNFVKIKPVLDALEARGVETVLVHTGQHYDAALDEVFFEDLAIREPDHRLGVGSGSHAEQTAAVVVAMERILADSSPDAVVVVGDVNSTMATALAAAKSPSVLAHVEAGLRSRDWSMPEEVNRVVTDRISDVLLSPSPDAVENLRAEGCPPERIHLVGNVMVDSLLAALPRARSRSTVDDLDLSPRSYGIVTLHRPSNVDDTDDLAELLEVLGVVAERCPLLFPVHPRTRVRLGQGVPPGIRVIEPLGYLDFLALQDAAALVLTDSGGIQEETTVLGVPCLTLRSTTERPITVAEGTNVVVGRDAERIVTEAERALAGQFPVRRPALWDGRAAERIADVLCSEPLPEKGWWGGS